MQTIKEAIFESRDELDDSVNLLWLAINAVDGIECSGVVKNGVATLLSEVGKKLDNINERLHHASTHPKN